MISAAANSRSNSSRVTWPDKSHVGAMRLSFKRHVDHLTLYGVGRTDNAKATVAPAASATRPEPESLPRNACWH